MQDLDPSCPVCSRHLVRRFILILSILIGSSWLGARDAGAAGRMGRHMEDIPGMPVGMTDVGQDTTGYLWLSSSEGLSRYDGFEIRPWGEVAGRLTYVETGPQGQVLAGDDRTGLYEVDGPALRRVKGPGSVARPGPLHAIYDRDGRLWAAWDGRLLRRDGDAWLEIGGPEMADDSAFSLAPRVEGGVLVGSRHGAVWMVSADDRARRIAEDLGDWIMQVHDDPMGPVAAVRFGRRPGLVRITDPGVDHLLDWEERIDGLARRGSTYWLAYPTGVWAVHDDGSREFLAAGEGFTGFGNISVDREGGLWMASVRGLSHYPQPETRLWTELSGLPHVFLRSVHPVPDGFILTSWSGPIHLGRDGRARKIPLGSSSTRSAGCHDPWGGVWLKGMPVPGDAPIAIRRRPEAHVLLEWRGGNTRTRRRTAWYEGDIACDVAPDGSFWILAGGELLELDGPDAELQVRGRLPDGTPGQLNQTAFVVRRDGSAVVAGYYTGEICQAPLPPAGRILEPADWACAQFQAGTGLLDLMETPTQRLWLAADGGGVYEWVEGQGRRVQGEMGELREAIGLSPSPAGGIWVMGWRHRWRMVERAPGTPPSVVERLETGHGVPAWENGRGLHEEPDGTVWVPLYSGLARVPPEVRRHVGAAPAVTITRLVADGRQVDGVEDLSLRHGGHSLELRWSALSFRDPTSVRYRMRMENDPDWTVLSQPYVRLAGLAAGRHRIELGASLDGRIWSDPSAVLAFKVQRPWYRQGWFVALALAAFLMLIYVAHRLRLAHLLRLERQRTRIAMDLHDEMGAGLGSAGLLVGLLADGDLERQERRDIGARAAAQIRDLGGALSDIVWSLRPGAETLDALLLFLRQRAADLFPPGDGPRVRFDAPDPCPPLPLRLSQRRNLQWMAVEALHNAARHAGARRVVVTLRPAEAGRWRLSVRDDGAGLPAGAGEGGESGLGQESMRRRAAEIGADLQITSAQGEGVEVTIWFRPDGRAR